MFSESYFIDRTSIYVACITDSGTRMVNEDAVASDLKAINFLHL